MVKVGWVVHLAFNPRNQPIYHPISISINVVSCLTRYHVFYWFHNLSDKAKAPVSLLCHLSQHYSDDCTGIFFQLETISKLNHANNSNFISIVNLTTNKLLPFHRHLKRLYFSQFFINFIYLLCSRTFELSSAFINQWLTKSIPVAQSKLRPIAITQSEHFSVILSSQPVDSEVHYLLEHINTTRLDQISGILPYLELLPLSLQTDQKYFEKPSYA